jgi:signal transduction histidine kinase
MTTLDLLLLSPWPYLVTAALAALTGGYVWTRPRRPGARSFGGLAGLWLVWSLAAALQVMVRDYPLLLGLYVLMSCIVMLEPVLHLMIALEYTGNEKWLARRSRGFISIRNLLFLPAVLVALIYILWPDWLGTVDVHAGVQVVQANATLTWIFAPYPFLISLLTFGVLLNCLLRSPAFWAPLLLLSLGRFFPTVGYLVVESWNIPVPSVQATILFAGFTMLLYLLALYSFRILQVIPVARDAILAHIPYALIVLDAENRLVDFNAAAQSLPGLPARLSLHRAAEQELAGWWQRLVPLIGPQPVSHDLPVSNGPGEQIFHATSLPLVQASGRQIGQAFLLEDITQARQVQQQQEQTQRALAILHEREQLARELHDNLSQTLAFTGIQLEAASKNILDGQVAAGMAQLNRLAGIVREAHTDLRENILDLHTAPVPQQPFFTALRRYLEGFTDNYGIQTMLEVDERLGEQPFPQDSRMQVFRILQEALSNARKHARAHCVQVSFAREDHFIRMTIQDDGAGFDSTQAAGDGHFGLKFMRERAETLDGRLEVESAVGKGTKVEVEIPVNGER